MQVLASEFISDFKIVFFDFDGVIKESVQIKNRAFNELFSEFGVVITRKILRHHKKNSGLSRFTKIPTYLKWAGINASDENVSRYANKFSSLVTRKVTESPYVPGADTCIKKPAIDQLFILVTATPLVEIEEILALLNIRKYFFKVYGGEYNKAEAIKEILVQRSVSRADCLLIGDSESDIDAAKESDIKFLLRLHKHNANLLDRYHGNFIQDFL